MEEEERLINELHPSGFLLNKSLKCTHGNIKPIIYEHISKYVEISNDSPSGLRWKVDIYSGLGYGIKEVSIGDVAGRYSARGYWATSINSCRYTNHRLIWSLANKQDITDNLVVDHINRNKQDNSPENLRLVTKAENNRNRSLSARSKSGVVGISFAKSTNYWIVTYKYDGKRTISFKVTDNNKDAVLLLAIEFKQLLDAELADIQALRGI